jgi:hypothetical protein
MGRRQIRCHGDDRRFEVVATLIGESTGPEVQHVADVAGGRGLLSRLLKKRFSIDSELIDPRRYALKGVPHRMAEFVPGDASYYDLIVGLHPDRALRAVVESAPTRPTIVVPCCNFWSAARIGLNEMLQQIERWYREHGVDFRLVTLDFKGPYNRAFLTRPGRRLS